MGVDPSSTSDIPMLVALIILFIGLYFRGLILWISLALALLYLYIFDRESIVTLVIYGFTASLLIAGYLRIKKGLKLTESRVNKDEFDLVLDANNLIGTANWDLDIFVNFDFDIIIANPPYIKTEVIKKLEPEVRCYDPIISLDGGKNGLDCYKKIPRIQCPFDRLKSI